MASFYKEQEWVHDEFPNVQFTIHFEGDLWHYGRNLDYEFEIVKIDAFHDDGYDFPLNPELVAKINELFKVNEELFWKDTDLLDRVDEQSKQSMYDDHIDRLLNDIRGK